MRFKRGLIFLIALFTSVLANNEDDYVIVEEEHEEHKGGRILWPYPLQENASLYRDPHKPMREQLQRYGVRGKRFLAYKSHLQSPVVDMMMQSLSIDYVPKNPNDPFDFLRDTYPLPKGNMRTYFSLLLSY